MVEITYWPKRVIFCSISFAFRIFLAAVFWGKKKSVPSVKNELLLKPAYQLANEIRRGKLKSEEVIQAYITRIQEVEPYINAVVQDNFDEALKEARRVDAFIQKGNFSIGQLSEEKPFFGVPFTVKCLLKVKGFQNTGSSLIYKYRIADTDAPPVSKLKEAGGIFLALTNSPEYGLSIETVNNLYGRTCNPYDLSRTCGGSSGGEAALLSSAGSIIGLGNDLLGSVRIPSHYCSLFAHKPSENLISSDGSFLDLPPLMKKFYTAGPMCRYSKDLLIMMKVLQQDEEIPLEKEVNFQTIKIYYQKSVEHAWVLDTDKEIVQAVHNAASFFKKKYGTKVKEVKIPLLNKTNAILLNSISGRIPNIIKLLTDGKVNKLYAIIEFIKMFFGKCRFTFTTVGACFCGKAFLFFDKKLTPKCDQYMEELKDEFEELLDDNSLFFFPTMPTTAPYHRETFVHIPSSCFTSPFSLLGLPSTQCPIGFSKQGLPIGIQIVASKGNDALTLLTAVELEKTFGGWVPP